MVPASEWQPMGIHLCRSLSPEAVSVFPVVFALFGIEFYRPFISVWPFRGWQYRYLERLGVLAEVDPGSESDRDLPPTHATNTRRM